MIVFTLDQLRTVPDWQTWLVRLTQKLTIYDRAMLSCEDNDFIVVLDPMDDLAIICDDYIEQRVAENGYEIELLSPEWIDRYKGEIGYDEIRRLLKEIYVDEVEYLSLYETLNAETVVDYIASTPLFGSISRTNYINGIVECLRTRVIHSTQIKNRDNNYN